MPSVYPTELKDTLGVLTKARIWAVITPPFMLGCALRAIPTTWTRRRSVEVFIACRAYAASVCSKPATNGEEGRC